jgi:hypothetical protein
MRGVIDARARAASAVLRAKAAEELKLNQRFTHAAGKVSDTKADERRRYEVRDAVQARAVEVALLFFVWKWLCCFAYRKPDDASSPPWV